MGYEQNAGMVATGTLAASPQTAVMSGMPMPCSVFLNSTATGRAIALSVDGGVNWQTPAYDFSSTAQLVVALSAPVTHVQFTGNVGDIWGVC